MSNPSILRTVGSLSMSIIVLPIMTISPVKSAATNSSYGIGNGSAPFPVYVARVGRQTSEASGPPSSARPNMVESPAMRAMVEAGWNYIRAGDFRAALALFDQAKAISPRDPRIWLGLGISQYRLSRFEPATSSLLEALDLDPSLEQAHALLGALAFMRDDLPGAIRHYESAQVLNPNDVVIQDGLYAARRALQFEAGFMRVVTPHFIVKGEAVTLAAIRGVADRLELLYQRVGDALKYRPDDRTIVVLYSDYHFRRLTDGPMWAGGLFDGKIHLVAQRVLEMSATANGILAHEYSHALVHRLAGDRVPTWLDEGLALYFEGGRVELDRDMLAHRTSDLIPLHALHGSFLNLPPHEAALAYAESRSATSLLIVRYGWVRLHSLLDLLSRGDDFNTAFETAFKEPYHAFESVWISVERHRGL